ncbi:glycosyltransferase family 2 protein [Cohaesibacter marisflavi]|nr:glycosyltransferase family 2 protein [Cohaesibacter marisflavi]
MQNSNDKISLPVSAFIITLNEEDRIEKAILSVIDWVDEVIVVDSGSTDNTTALAEALGAKVHFNAWPGYGRQKRFGEDLCRNDWLLNIDADEEVTPELRDKICSIFKIGPDVDIYKIEILDVFAHEDKPKKWAYGYWQYRLYNRNKGRFSESTVHDTVRPEKDATIKKLDEKIAHYSIRSVQWAVEKMNRYSDMQRDDIVAKGRHISRWRLVYEFPLSFLKSYILRRSYRYGFWGLVLAHNYAFSRFLRIAKIYEHQLLSDAKKK